MIVKLDEIIDKIWEQNSHIFSSKQKIRSAIHRYLTLTHNKLNRTEDEVLIRGIGKFILTKKGEIKLEERKKHQRKIHTKKVVKYLTKTRYSWVKKFIDDSFEN